MLTHCTVKQFIARHGIGRTTFYELVRKGELRTVKLGRRTLIPSDSETAWAAALPTDGPTEKARIVAAGSEQWRNT